MDVTAGGSPRVLIVSHYAGERTGGEGSIPLRLLGQLRNRGIEAWLLTHESKRDELASVLPADQLERVRFAGSLPGLLPVYTWGKRMPPGPRTLAWGVTQLERQVAMLPVVRRLVHELAIDVVHQPISVSPVIPSPLRDLGVPVVMGPLNGGTRPAPAFADRDSRLSALVKAARPVASSALNFAIRGRLSADAVLVANDRTRALLPRTIRGTARSLSDIGVVLESWPPRTASLTGPPAALTRFVTVGRLVDVKGVDIVLEAFARFSGSGQVELDIIGEGPEHDRLRARADALGLAGRVHWRGWLDPAECSRALRAADVYVTGSLQEAGGVSVLEAMASGLPVIATGWGGHLDTLDASRGILVDVSSREATVTGMAAAMAALAADPARRDQLGAAGRQHVRQCYDWATLIDHTLQIYARVTGACTGKPPAEVR